MTLPEIVNDAIKYDPSYWANPKNYYHQKYKRAINRRFAVLFLLAFVAMLYSNLGPVGFLTFAGWAFVSIAVSALFYLVFFEAVPSFISWLKGD